VILIEDLDDCQTMCSRRRCSRPAVQQVTMDEGQKTIQWWLCGKHAIKVHEPESYRVTFAGEVQALSGSTALSPANPRRRSIPPARS
jgi:hypothetical protein